MLKIHSKEAHELPNHHGNGRRRGCSFRFEELVIQLVNRMLRGLFRLLDEQHESGTDAQGGWHLHVFLYRFDRSLDHESRWSGHVTVEITPEIFQEAQALTGREREVPPDKILLLLMRDVVGVAFLVEERTDGQQSADDGLDSEAAQTNEVEVAALRSVDVAEREEAKVVRPAPNAKVLVGTTHVLDNGYVFAGWHRTFWECGGQIRLPSTP